MYLAIDIGGTKTLIATYTEAGEVTEQIKFPTPEKYNDFILEMENNVDKLSTKEFARCVVAIPGRVDRKTGVALAFGNRDWINVPIGADIEAIIRVPVLLENDAKLGALSEAVAILDTYQRTLYVTISTGIGAGLIEAGKIPPEHQDMEVGHILLEYQDRLTEWEDFGSGHAFQQKFGTRVGDTPDDNTEAWYWLGRNIAIGLSTLCAILTPEVVVIGGGAGAHLDKFHDRLVEQMKLYEHPTFPMPPIIAARHPETAVINGCYELAKQTDPNRT